MPLSRIASHFKYLHPEALAQASNETRHRYALADWIEARKAHRTDVNLRRAVIGYMRSTGDLAPNGRWSRGNHAKVLLLFGSQAAFFLKRTGTIPVAEATHTLRLMRDPPPVATHVAPILDDTLELSLYDRSTTSDVPHRIARTQLDRDIQRGQCGEFAHWLDSRRKGACNPRRAYRQWRGRAEQDIGTGRWINGMPPHAWIKKEIEDRLGAAAAHLVLNTPSIDRRALAAKLRSL